jgi:two-component system phosphate regulon sensor histidine kinase PhoR
MIQWWVFPLDAWAIVFMVNITEQYHIKKSGRLLLSNLSHELRTPLASILTHLEIVSAPDMPEEAVQQSLQLLKQEGQRMSRLVNQMLDLGRIASDEAGDYRYVHLLTIAEEAVAQVLPLATSKDSLIVLKAAPSLPPVCGDDSRLKQVFLNLLDNAIKHTAPGTQVVLSLQAEKEGLACAVSDNGAGIPAEHLAYITHRFYRVAPQSVEGSGLGLALVAEILHRHQSRLVIESDPEGAKKGVRVRFILPYPPERELK